VSFGDTGMDHSGAAFNFQKQALQSILVKKNIKKQFKKGQKCHVTLWLTPSFPLCFLVTLLQPPLPP